MHLNIQDNPTEIRTAIYIRVSTQEQKIDGYGLESQENRLLEYIKLNKSQNFITKKEWMFVDTHTGSDLNREGLNKMLEIVKKKEIDAVLVWKIDRLSRNLSHLMDIFENLEKNNVSFKSIQENIDFRGPIGKLVFQVFGAIAQFERELIKGRTVAGRITSAEMGNYTGSSIPYGYKPVYNKNGRGKKLEIIPKEKEWINQIFDWCVFNHLGFGQIASELNKLNVPLGQHSIAKKGKWTTDLIRKILHNNIYTGIYTANNKDDLGRLLPEEKWTNVKVPQCINTFIFSQAQIKMREKKSNLTNQNYLLSGKIIDISIPKPKTFVGCKRTKGGFSYRRKQFDSDGIHYPVFEIPAKVLDDYVWERLSSVLKKPEIIYEKLWERKNSKDQSILNLKDQLESLESKDRQLENESKRIEKAYETGVYSEEKLKEKMMDIEKEKSLVKESQEIVQSKLIFISQIEKSSNNYKAFSAQLQSRKESLTIKQKKIIIDFFIDRINIDRSIVEGKSQIDATIHFRSNPERLPQLLDEGRTNSPLSEDKKHKKSSKKYITGATTRI